MNKRMRQISKAEKMVRKYKNDGALCLEICIWRNEIDR
jgi:hypothetical protein